MQVFMQSDCLKSGNISCTCIGDGVNCYGHQEYLLQSQELLANVSALYSTGNLRSLVLNISGLSFPHDFTFEDFQLEELHVERDLRELPDNTFTVLESTLTVLVIKNNEFGNLKSQLFSSLILLKELNLESNRLSSIDGDIFANMSKLENLSLSANNISVLNKGSFENLPSLLNLNFDFNNLSSVDNLNLIISDSLVSLSVKNNILEGEVTKDTLFGTPKLQILDLSMNGLVEINSFAFSKLSSLKELNLSNNELIYLKDNAFSALTDLEILDLHSNKIKMIAESSFSNIINLKYLDLSFNMLEAVLSAYTKEMYSLERINLMNNRIKIIIENTFDSSQALQEILLEGNTLDCTCEMFYFYQFLNNNSHIKVGDEIVCSSPASLSGTDLLTVDFVAMNCELPVQDFDDHEFPATNSSIDAETTTKNVTNDITEGTDSSATISDATATTESYTTDITNTKYTTTEDSSEYLFETIGHQNNTFRLAAIEETTTNTASDSFTTESSLSSTVPYSVIIYDNSVSDKDFCLRWGVIGGLPPTAICILDLHTERGKKVNRLRCPATEGQVQQCFPKSGEIFEFCLNVRVGSSESKGTCMKLDPLTTVETTSSTEKPSTNTMPSTKMPSTNTMPSLTSQSLLFEIQSLSVVFNHHDSIAVASWSVNRDEPEYICSLVLSIVSSETNRSSTIGCINGSYSLLLGDSDSHRICLTVMHRNQEIVEQCQMSSKSQFQASSSKDGGYQNYTLIAVLCLLVAVVCVVAVIVSKNMCKNRIESDRYNVCEAEDKVYMRSSTQRNRNAHIRYSYTPKGDIDCY